MILVYLYIEDIHIKYNTVYNAMGGYMKYAAYIVLFCFAIASSIDASHKKITILVHGTGSGYKARLGRSFRYCPEGLHHIGSTPDIGSYYVTKQKMLAKDTSRFDGDHFYAFGWSGNLGFKVRKKAGKRLAEQLADLARAYKEKYTICPHVRIITFSHGGNVALYIAEFANSLPEGLSIELIMLGSPIQASTEKFIHHECFKKVYNIFSQDDVIQRIDPQNLYAPVRDESSFFSRRIFAKPSVKCKQAKVTICNKGLGHLDMMHGIPSHLSHILSTLDQHNSSDVCPINIDQKNYVHFRGYNVNTWLNAHCV